MELHCVAARSGKLSTFLQREMRCSSSFIHKMKWQQCFYVNGVAQRTNYLVSPGDEIRIPIQESAPDYPAEQGALEILYEDDAVIALDKPPGLLMHPSFHRNTGTLANYLAGYYQTTGQHSAVHPVSRLDRDTFGVVLLAKNAYIHALLCEAMRAGQLHKIYHALVLGGPDEQAGVIDKPIARLPKPSLLRCVRADGQRAITRYRVLAQHNGCSLLALEPVTGRTHQLRVHCADAGFPILGDPQYGTADSSAVSVRWGYTTQQLCACQLSFPHPMTGETVTLSTRRDIILDALKFSGISCQNRESDV